jgi:Ca2+-binding EF-hand superfamily protein
MSKAKASNPTTTSTAPISASTKLQKATSWRERLSAEDLEELKGVFDLFDDDKGGTIDPIEV